MLWQRFTARRALTATPVECRWGSHGTRYRGAHTRGAHTRGARRSHVPLVVREPEAGWWQGRRRATVTVAAVREGDAAGWPDLLVARLAALAVDEALLVVLGSGARSVQHAMVADLRGRLPRHEIVAMRVRHRHDDLLRDAATVERLLDAGSLPVVVTPAAALHDVTAEIASFLRADRVLRVTAGAELCQVWQRHAEPSVN